MIKNLLVTGNLGYIGTILTKYLEEKKYNVVGYDNGYYENNIFGKDLSGLAVQIKKDIRDIESEDLSNIDCVIHLAGLSNDPYIWAWTFSGFLKYCLKSLWPFVISSIC